MSNEEALKLIDGICPELNIHQKLVTADYRWFWSFRCMESDEVIVSDDKYYFEDPGGGFASPIEALANFAQYMIDSQDEEMGLNDDDDE